MKNFNLKTLYKIIEKRIKDENKDSYSYKLYKNPKLLYKKILEEANELIRTKNKKQAIWETSDLLYFMLVFLVKRKIKLEQIEKKLMERNKNKEKLSKLKKKEVNGIKLKTKTKKSLNILFICKYNRFRSRIAKAYFDKINKNKRIKAESAGVIKGRPLSELSVKTAKRLGLDIRGKPRGLSTNLLLWQNMIVIVADDVPPSIFSNNKKYGKKVIVWKIKDIPAPEGSETEKKKTIKAIVKKVDGLNKMLNKEGK